MNFNRYIFVFLILATACKKEISIDETDPVPTTYPTWSAEPFTATNTNQVVFFAENAGANASFHIYLPDEYFTDSLRDFPVIYWLHGGGVAAAAGGSVAVEHYHQAIDRGDLPPCIVVLPYGLPFGMWCDSKDGSQKIETMCIQDLIPYVDEHYRTITTRRGRIVEGFSMGGYGAARFGFKYANIFGGFSALGAGPMQLDFSVVAPQNQANQPIIFEQVYGNDMSYFEAQSPWRLAEEYGLQLPVPTPKRFLVGGQDFVFPAKDSFVAHIAQLGIPHQYSVFPNLGHVALPLWNALGNQNWVFYRSVFP